ncbi:testis-specific gene A8 protein-like [Schistocerca nitens]|uniref:testis-specific gene A8 protein-like n=1 Tax=Schistocerca nitens TaxID=7011 RepID=UPI0021174AB0|nr:testis-specific gene A8 protein-like [Schistocerca nitens]
MVVIDGMEAKLVCLLEQQQQQQLMQQQQQLQLDILQKSLQLLTDKLPVLDATGRRDPRREAASPDAASTAAEWVPDKALRCQTPWGCPRKAAAIQAAQPPLGKAARLRGRRPSAPKAVATEEGPQAPERPPGALPHEAAREASTGRAVGVVAATAAAAAALGAAAKSEVLADKTMDIAGTEQLSLSARYFDLATNVVREDFLGFTPLARYGPGPRVTIPAPGCRLSEGLLSALSASG